MDMSRVMTIIKSLVQNPGYTLMRGVARFAKIRTLVSQARSFSHGSRTREYLTKCESAMSESCFADLDRADFVRRLREEGIAFGLSLPTEVVEEIRDWADRETCYADRESALGFRLGDRAIAEATLGKPILLAQYFNTTTDCPPISRLATDPALRWIAASYLGSLPTFVGANLWWTFPVEALEADRAKHAHVFHRDVDDFRFFKFFFYLSDVPTGEGAHVCVSKSHNQPPQRHYFDQWNIRRYSDKEIASTYPNDHVLEICGPAGTGFSENTLCIHKGSTPRNRARLLLQLQFALFDHGVMHDHRVSQTLSRLV